MAERNAATRRRVRGAEGKQGEVRRAWRDSMLDMIVKYGTPRSAATRNPFVRAAKALVVAVPGFRTDEPCQMRELSGAYRTQYAAEVRRVAPCSEAHLRTNDAGLAEVSAVEGAPACVESGRSGIGEHLS